MDSRKCILENLLSYTTLPQGSVALRGKDWPTNDGVHVKSLLKHRAREHDWRYTDLVFICRRGGEHEPIRPARGSHEENVLFHSYARLLYGSMCRRLAASGVGLCLGL